MVHLIARLFAAEKIISNMKDLTETKRLRERERMCRPLVDAMFAFSPALMYSLVESCRMNGLDFGLYIETVLRRILDGDTDIHGMLPNVITLPKEGQNSSAA